MTDWTIADLTARYAAVLRQLLPAGGYDRSPDTVAAQDIYAHAKVLAQADKNGRRILQFLQAIPPELLDEVETEIGLPLTCSVPDSKTLDERLAIVNWVKNTHNVFNRAYLAALLTLFGVTLLDMKKYVPIRCTAQCTEPVNSERLRYKVRLYVADDVTADMQCIIEHYLPAYLRVDVEWVPRRFMSSLPYALYTVEGVRTDYGIVDWTQRDVYNVTDISAEHTHTALALDSVIVRDVMQSYSNNDAECVNSQMSIVQVVSRDLLTTSAVQSDNVQSAMAVVNVSTADVLLTTTADTEHTVSQLALLSVQITKGDF